MLGLMEDIMEQTDHKFDIDLFKKIIYKKTHNIDFILKIAMIIMIVIIAIILMLIPKDNNKNNYLINNQKNDLNQKIELSTDKDLINFVENYFKARTELRYDVIFSSFNKVFKNEMFNEEEKKIINSIRYERAYIKSFNNIKVWTYKGQKENETVAIIVYDMMFSYTTNSAPNIIMTYIVNDNGKYYFKDDIDIGLSKYLNEISTKEEVVDLYNEVENRLEKIVNENEDLKLTYNSLRQYKMNNYEQSDFNFAEEVMSLDVDPVKDKEEIDKVLEENKVIEDNINPIIKNYNNIN